MLRMNSLTFTYGEKRIDLFWNESELVAVVCPDENSGRQTVVHKSKLIEPPQCDQLAFELWKQLTGKYPNYKLVAQYMVSNQMARNSNPESQDVKQRDADEKEYLRIALAVHTLVRDNR